MHIATWNVNSIRIRHERLLAWLQEAQPDVLCLQELKCVVEQFPIDAITALGYQSAVAGQRTYNGVAILSKQPMQVGAIEGHGVGNPEEARLIHVFVQGFDVYSVYVPNGGEVSSEKYTYKKAWLDGLLGYLGRKHTPSDKVILAGDFNIAPEDLDVAQPDTWRESVLCHTEVRQRFSQLLNLGYADGFRLVNKDGGFYSWWDYRQLGFPKNNGLRIDHLLVSAALQPQVKDARIDRNQRKGKQPSDHAPVSIFIDV